MRKWRWGSGLLMRAVAFSSLLLVFAAQASASVILNYAGQNFTSIALSGPTTPSDLYTTADHVSGFIELAAPLGANLVSSAVTPLSFSFFDGVNTLTDLGAAFLRFKFSTDGAGQVVGWDVLVREEMLNAQGKPDRLMIIAVHDFMGASTAADFANDILCGPSSSVNGGQFGCSESGDPYYYQFGGVAAEGIWTAEAKQVPVPATLALLGLGLAGLGFSRRKQ